MVKAGYSDDLLFTIDYILHRADPRELEALAAALERRQGQLNGVVNGSIPFTPEQAAKKCRNLFMLLLTQAWMGYGIPFGIMQLISYKKKLPSSPKNKL